MDGEYGEKPKDSNEYSIHSNEQFLKHHKKLDLGGDLYSKTTIERIEKDCGCQVICNPYFDGISFYVRNECYNDAQNIIRKIAEEDRVREERIARKKADISEKVRKRFDRALAECENPDDNEREFAEKCLKTLRIEDYVQAPEAEKYRKLYSKYSEYFKLVGWPEDVEGSAAKQYLNASFVRDI